MKNNASAVFSLFLIIGDFLALVAAFAVAYFMRFRWFDTPGVPTVAGRAYIMTIISILPLWIIVNGLLGLYNQGVYERRFRELGRLLFGSFLGILMVIGYDFVTEDRLLPGRLVPLYGLVIGFTFLVIFRSIARWIRHGLFHYGIGISNILIVGDTAATSEIATSMADTRNTGVRIIGIVGHESSDNFRHFDSFSEALDKLNDLPHGIIQTELYKAAERNDEILRFAQTNHISYRFVPGNSDLFVGNITVELFAGLPVIAVHQTPLIGWGRILKRLFDIVLSLCLVIFLAPFYALVAICILIFDPKGGVIFKQKRLTRFDQEFTCYKFRTLKKKYSGLSPEEAFDLMGKPSLKKTYRDNGDFLPNDPRLSAIGRFIRKTSIDELPQLFNVLKGDISLVGPRALVPQELKAYEKRHKILSVKSGLTGLAQISGRRDISFEERRTIDMYYVQNWTFWMDISILLRTIRAVINGSGAK